MTTETERGHYNHRHRDCPDCGRPQVQYRGEWVHLYQLDEPRCRPAETIPDGQTPQWHHDTLNWWSTRHAPRS